MIEVEVGMLKFHTQEMPEMVESGARYVVVAHFENWRDGLATNYAAEIPRLQQELRKRFMNRLQPANQAIKPST